MSYGQLPSFQERRQFSYDIPGWSSASQHLVSRKNNNTVDKRLKKCLLNKIGDLSSLLVFLYELVCIKNICVYYILFSSQSITNLHNVIIF